MSRIPSLNRKIRVLVDWSLALLLRREVVSLGQLHHPREEFTEVTPFVALKEASAKEASAEEASAESAPKS
jgi:NADH dehydrogenase